MKMPEVRVASVLEQEEANGNIEADASQSSQWGILVKLVTDVTGGH